MLLSKRKCILRLHIPIQQQVMCCNQSRCCRHITHAPQHTTLWLKDKLHWTPQDNTVMRLQECTCHLSCLPNTRQSTALAATTAATASATICKKYLLDAWPTANSTNCSTFCQSMDFMLYHWGAPIEGNYPQTAPWVTKSLTSRSLDACNPCCCK